MTLTEILADEELRRREFPVAGRKTYLAHAGVSPLPRRVADDIARYADGACLQDQEAWMLPGLLEGGRALAARLLGCHPDEAAFVGPTSLALSMVASGLKFRRQDNILVYFDDFPSNVYPWIALAEQGLEVRLMNTRGLGWIRPVDVMGQVDEHTRLVALASCHFISGYRLDLASIGQQLRERGILFCVDAIQTLGAFPTPAEWVDVLAADAHKWLLGPCGAGLLYVRREVREQVNPPVYGWNNVVCPDFIAQEGITYREGPRKWEAGTHNLVGLVGLRAAMELILEIGVENIGRELLRKRAWLVPELQRRGCAVLHADVPAINASGIVSFSPPGGDTAGLQRRLSEAGVIVSVRVDRAGRRYVRVSPHFYNTDRELQRFLECL